MRIFGRRIITLIIISIAFSTSIVSADNGNQSSQGPDWATFKSSLILYRNDVLMIKSSIQPDTKNLVKAYINACIDIADSCTAALEENKTRIMDLPAIETAIKQRNAQQDILMDNVLMSDPLVRQEIARYKETIYPYMAERYLGLIRARNVLWEEKYFTDWGKQGNFLEAWLNSHTPWTSYSSETENLPPNYGVSPWEFTIRAEPIVLLEGNYNAAALLALGCLYNSFPKVEVNDKGEVKTERDFFNKYLAKIGPRIGVGTTFNSPHDLLVSGGLQIRAWSVWYTYNTHDYHWSFAIGLSDWTWVKEFLPYFGLL